MFGDSQQLSTQVALYVGEDTSSESRSQNLNSIAWNVQEGNFNLKDLITELGMSLVSVNDNERARAAQLLGEVISLVPGSVQLESVQQHVVQFLSSRLSDWPSVHGCLKGTAGLQAAAAVQLQPSQTAMLVKALLEVQISSLPQADRMMALTILSTALKMHGLELVAESEVDVLQGVIAGIDGEKDPRCLMLSFQLAQQVICIYEQAAPQVAAAQTSLDANKEELFDVISCYFPISFSPPPSTVHAITRQDLAAALQEALTCTPLFAPLFIPMLVEKLCSSLRQAKLDALTALTAAAGGYGPPGLHPHLSTVWLALRAELLAPAAPALLPADLASAQQIAEKAAECVSKSIAALGRQGDDSLMKLILADEQVCGDLLGCLTGLKQRESQDPALRVKALTRVAAAVVEGSLSACQATCKQLLPPLATAASDSQSVRQQSDHYHKPHQTQQLALSAVLAIIKAAVTAAAAAAAAAASAQTTTMPDQVSSGNKQMQAVGGPGEDPLAGTGAAVFHAITAGQRQHGQRSSDPGGNAARVGEGPGGLLDGGQSGGGDDGSAAMQHQAWQQLAGKTASQAGVYCDSEGGGDDSKQDGVQLLRLQVLTELVAFPAACSPLSTQELEEALHQFLNCLRSSSSHSKSAAVQATSALIRMADAGHMSLLEQGALAPLLESATATNSSQQGPQQGPWQGALALQALAALAAPALHLRRHILGSMQRLVPAMLAASIGNEHNQQMVVAMLHVIRHKLAPFADNETEAAGSLGLNLLTATLQLTTAGHTAAEDVAIACAEAVQSAVAGCDASQQARICHIACNHLDKCCTHLPQHSAAPSPANNSSHSLGACTGLQQHGSSQQLAMPDAREQLASTAAAAPESGMPTLNSSSTANSLHSEGEVLRLLAQGAVVSAAAVAAVRPNVLPHDRAKPLLECLVKLAMQLPEGRSQEACVVAAAAVINKWPPGSTDLDDTIASVLKLLDCSWIADLAQPAIALRAASQNSPSPCSFTCFAHLLKGACMAAHKAALPLVALPLSYLNSFQSQGGISGPEAASATPWPSAPLTAVSGMGAAVAVLDPASTPQRNTATKQCFQAAAATYETVPSNQASVLSLSNDMAHVIVKPLWQQRFYTVALQQLKKLLQQSEAADSLSQAGKSSQCQSQQGPLLLALAYLLKGTPAKISRADLPQLLRWLLKALELLQQPDQCTEKAVMADLVERVKTMIEDPTGRATVEPEVQRIVSTLTSLTYCNESDLRVGSLQCLVVIMELPYHLLHPHRKQVLAALTSSIDDNKRRVRQEAVKCLKVWNST